MVSTQEERTKVIIGLEKPNIHMEGCTKHEIMLEGQVLEQEDSDKVQGNFFVECLCMFLFHYTNLVEMQCTHIRFHIFCSSFACFHYVE
jgi:hypothetical protein